MSQKERIGLGAQSAKCGFSLRCTSCPTLFFLPDATPLRKLQLKALALRSDPCASKANPTELFLRGRESNSPSLLEFAAEYFARLPASPFFLPLPILIFQYVLTVFYYLLSTATQHFRARSLSRVAISLSFGRLDGMEHGA